MRPPLNRPAEKHPGACDLCGEWDVDLVDGVCHKLACRSFEQSSAEYELTDHLADEGVMLGCGS